MKTTLHHLLISMMALVFAFQMQAQCDSGTLPVVFQFTTCCVGSVSNMVSYTIYNETEEIVDQNVMDISGVPGVYAFDICLPEGCYYATLSYSAGFNTSQHLSDFTALGESTSSFNIFQTSNNIPFSFGFCVTSEVITCQASFTATVQNNGIVSFVNNSTPTEGFTNVFVWNYGDGTNAQGLQPSHTYNENGTYEICVYQALYQGDIPICVSEFCQTIEMTTVPDNSGCPTELIVTAGESCGAYVIEHNGEELGNNYWFVDDALSGNGPTLAQNYTTQSAHQICLAHVSATCESSATVCTLINNPDCSNSLCPTQITTQETGCHSYSFQLNNIGNFGNLVWDFGNGTTSAGQNNVNYTFDTLGVYNVCVMAYGAFCQAGVEICTEVVVGPCGGLMNDCEGTIYHSEEELCGHFHFEAGANNSTTPIVWHFGDGTTVSTTASVIDHYYTQPGTYTVTAQILNESCPNFATLYTIVTVIECFPVVDCPDGLFAINSNECPTWNFELGGAAPGESVSWNFGDGQQQMDDHFVTHTFAENGTYEVCGTFTSDYCTEGVQFCTTIIVDCGIYCSLEIEQIPTTCGLAIFQANVNINVAEVHWTFNGGNDILTGEIVTIQTTDGTYPICAWYDSEACITAVEACAQVVVDNCEACTELTFGFDSFINDGGTPYLIWTLHDANDMTQIDNGIAQFSTNDPYYDDSICLENGCYLLTAYNNSPFDLEAVIPQIGSNATVISIDSFNSSGLYGYEVLFSLNGNCNVDCDAVGFSYVSYPSYGGMAEITWSLYNSSEQLVNGNVTDFIPMETDQYYSDCLEEDCYTMVFTGSQSFEGNQWFASSFSGPWTATSTSYGEINGQHSMVVNLNLNSNCNVENCFLELTAVQLENGQFEFTAFGYPEVYPMTWNFGDNESLEATWVTMHQYTEPGVYIVCASIQTDGCGTVEACVAIEVEFETNCNFSIWSGSGELCGDVIFEIPGGSSLGPIVWNFGNEIITDNQSIIHHFGTAGTYIVTASGSTNACPNFVVTTTVVVPECPSCTDMSVLMVSNTLQGGTDCMYLNITNLATNQSSTEFLEFGPNIMTHLWSNCLTDGCYSLTFDSCMPLDAGSGLDFDLIVNGESILDNAIITYQDNYAMTFEFGINSNCFSTDCTANFEISAGNNPGEILITNLSEMEGIPTYEWNFGNGFTNTGNYTTYTYLQNGTYEVCLTAANSMCEETHCQNITVSNSLCNETGIIVNLSSEFQLPNMSDELIVQITIEDNVIGQYQLDVLPNNNYALEFCVPDGCYSVELISNEPLIALGIFAEVVSNNVTLSETSILAGSFYSGVEFGINTPCGDFVSETTDAELVVYPNPATSNVQITLSQYLTIQQLQIFDSSGRIIYNCNPNDRSINVEHLSAGLYYLKARSNKGVIVRAIEILR